MSQAKLGISDEVNGKSEAPLERTPPRGKPPNNPGAPPTVLVHQFPPQTNKLGGLFSPLPKTKGKEGQRGERPKPFQSPPLDVGDRNVKTNKGSETWRQKPTNSLNKSFTLLCPHSELGPKSARCPPDRQNHFG